MRCHGNPFPEAKFDPVVEREEIGMLNFKIERDGDEFHAWCSSLPGCHTHGKTRKEALHNLKDAVILYIEDLEVKDVTLDIFHGNQKIYADYNGFMGSSDSSPVGAAYL